MGLNLEMVPVIADRDQVDPGWAAAPRLALGRLLMGNLIVCRDKSLGQRDLEVFDGPTGSRLEGR